MSNSVVHFFQGCPVCGRSLRIRVTLLGRRVYCQHCGGGFVAQDASMADAPPTGCGLDSVPAAGLSNGVGASMPPECDPLQPERSLTQRVDRLLERAARVLERSSGG
ncbi:MAG: hypothetical protein DWH79_07220 [Planctomycetota bacterium]|nr:MAG: hypothetical protein DWH79_07220 [Planctomycetota bacterium]